MNKTHGRWTPRFAFATLALLIGGCGAMRTHYVRPDLPVPATFAHADDSARASLDGWWHSFGDPNLDSLIDQALRRNSDLAGAAVRVRAAQLTAHLSAINPAVAADYSFSGAKQLSPRKPSTRSHSVSLTASYEVDLWGQLSAVRDAATWEAGASEQDRQAAALALVGTAVDLYYELAQLNYRISIGEQSLEYARRTWDLVRVQASAGSVAKLQVAESEQNVESQQAAQDALTEQRIEARNALTVLLDGTPWPESSELPTLPQSPPPSVEAGLPADILERRPDLHAAELRLRETLASTDAARLRFYPPISLSAGVGSGSSELSDLLRNPIGTLAATLSAPFLQVNQAYFTTQLARTQYQAATLAFRSTLLQALRDVDDALAARTELAEEGRHLEHSLDLARQAEHYDEVLYRNGAIALRTWLDAQELRRQAAIALASNRLSRLQNFSAVCQSLGGGAHRL